MRADILEVDRILAAFFLVEAGILALKQQNDLWRNKWNPLRRMQNRSIKLADHSGIAAIIPYPISLIVE